jgi:signal transduction histidine kinase
MNTNDGVVSEVMPVAQDYIQENDVILSINGVAVQDLNNSIQGNPTIQTAPGEILHIDLLRDGTEIRADMPKPEKIKRTVFELLSGEWVIPYPFFMAGLITILFIRPRSKMRISLYLFFYCYAIWISAGQISATGYWSANIVMRIFIWLSVPISFNLHWYFPNPFPRHKKWFAALLYGVPTALAILDILGFLPSGLYLFGFILSMGSALTLLIIKQIKFKQLRPLLWPLLTSYILATIPIIFMVLMLFLNMAPPQSNIALLGLTAIPGFYFFTAYKTNLKQDLPRINMAMKLFTWGITTTFVLSFIVAITPDLSINPLLQQILSFGANYFIGLTGFGILLIMPALANDQINFFQNKSYSLRFSANRIAAFINYLFAISLVYFLLLIFLPESADAPLSVILYAAAISILGTGFSIIMFQRFLRFFDRVVLGIKVPPESLVHQFTQKITLTLDYTSLARLLKEEVLPSLLIRESVLVLINAQAESKSLFRTGVSDEDHQAVLDLTQTNVQKKKPLNFGHLHAVPWVNLTLPLMLEERVIGYWYFGWRDPNNMYDKVFETVLKTLANQISITLLNIHQSELLQTLYNVNVERQEAEKASIARDLHDVLLPSLGYLVELQSNDSDQREFEKAIQQINDMIREIMSGLRPSSLDMGLPIALEELADEPEAQIGGKMKITTQLHAPTPYTYDQNVELHLYRIVQQACRNAYEHAEAQSIVITGNFNANQITLSVRDDGIGIPWNGLPNLSNLLANHHFGLANIYERAKIINANLSLHSSPQQGTVMEIVWTAKSDD